MSASRFPCLECAEPFDHVDERLEHWRKSGHGPTQVQLDAVDKARYSIMGEAAPPPERAYAEEADELVRPRREPVSRRRRNQMTLIRGGRL